jgi:hypothetical protein
VALGSIYVDTYIYISIHGKKLHPLQGGVIIDLQPKAIVLPVNNKQRGWVTFSAHSLAFGEKLQLVSSSSSMSRGAIVVLF